MRYELLPIEDIASNPEVYIEEVGYTGKHLVRTISHGPMKTVNIFAARISIIEKKGKPTLTIDVSNQTVTHIDIIPIR